jgi:hypothetical protein
MEVMTLADDPYGPFPWPDDWAHEYPLPRQVPCLACGGDGILGQVSREMALDAGEPAMEGQTILCDRCGSHGWIFEENGERCCENGFLPTVTGGYIECPLCAPQFV